MKLKFGNPNAKLKKMIKAKLGLRLKTFTLPAGYTCPGAQDCLSRADRVTGKVTDGKETLFRCFMASAESRSPSLRKLVWHNLELIQSALKDGFDSLVDLIDHSLPEKFDIMRVHVGGDYFSKEYLQAWIEVAKRNPEKVFYSYSKSLHLFKKYALPENLVLTASRGGKFDNLIDLHGWKEAVGDDTHAAFGKENFALLIHGTQPKGSAASKALSALSKKKKHSTSNEKEIAL